MANKKQALKIKKKFLVGLATWLNSLALSGRDSRNRTRFVGLLAQTIRLIEKERMEIIEKYVNKEKGDNGKEVWKKTVDNGIEAWDIPVDKKQEFSSEIEDLYTEDFVLDVSEEHKEKIACIRNIVLNTDHVFGPSKEDDAQTKVAKMQEANDYEEWCQAFESVTID